MYTVLYVDDEPALLELGKTFLELSGSITVETALSAKEGIEALKKNAFGCIISDYQMPEMDGLAFLKHLRKENNLIPFILFTGRGREEVIIDAVNNGVDYYLQKGGDPKSQFVELQHKVKLAIERRRTDDDLKESRQRMTDIVDHLPDATFAIDLDGKVIVWNRAMEEMTGVNKERILGTGDHSYALPFYGTRRPILLDLVLNDDEEIWKKYPQIIRKDHKFISEIYIPILYGGKGASLWFIASPLYDTHGNITGAIESIRDITDWKTAENERRGAYEQIAATEEELREQYDELKKSEDALSESEENYRTLFDEAADLIVIVDAHGTFLNMNRKFVEESGYEREAMMGKNVLTSGIVTAPSAAKIAFHLGKIFLGNKPPLFEIGGVAKNGTIIPYEIRATPIVKHGKVIAVQATLRNLTERKHAEKEISDRKKMLEEIVSGSPIPQFVIDKNHRIVSWNRALEEYSGVSAKEMHGTTHAWKAFYDTERPVLADLLVANEPEKIPEWYTGKSDRSKYVDGAYEATDFFPRMRGGGIWLYFTAAVLRDSEGNIVGAIETLEDITERKKAEEELRASYEQIAASEEELREQYDELKKREDALRESEKNYRSILEDIQDAYYRSDTAGNIILVSPSVAQLLGFDSVSELIGMNIAQSLYYNPEERKKLLAEITSRGSVTNYEVTLKKQDGTPVIVSTSSHKYYDENGNFLGVEGIFRDITELKRAQEDLRESENRYRTIFENTGAATVLIEENTIISLVNAEFVRLSGYSREEIEGKKRWTEFVVKEDLERMLAQHRLRRERHETAFRHYEFRFVTKTGEIHNIFLTIDVIPGTKKSVASLMDMTSQARAQDAMKLANKKLNLLSGITRHDIGNQLHALSEFLELSKESLADPARISGFTDKEMHIADTIARLINFTRDYEELGVNAPVWKNIHTIIGNVVTLLPMRDIRVDAGDPALEVFADPLLERVFYNLIDNALRYGGDRMTSIRISSLENGNGLVIVFEDDGAGIAIQDKAHLFTKGFGKNTGLGLFLSREILGITGITITENGEQQKGARFEITVPKGAYRFAGTT
ncbi:MAG: hybrid sensor histidine kinase/response regulator [Methanoregula sp.]